MNPTFTTTVFLRRALPGWRHVSSAAAMMAALFVIGCAPQVESDDGDDGDGSDGQMIPEGGSFFDFSITTQSDTCDPPLPTGDQGEVLVFLDGLTVNFPLPAWQSDVWSRQEMSLGGRELAGQRLVECPANEINLRLGAVEFDGRTLAIPMHEAWTEVGACKPGSLNIETPAEACVSDRVLSFTWVRPCPTPGEAPASGIHCD